MKDSTLSALTIHINTLGSRLDSGTRNIWLEDIDKIDPLFEMSSCFQGYVDNAVKIDRIEPSVVKSYITESVQKRSEMTQVDLAAEKALGEMVEELFNQVILEEDKDLAALLNTKPLTPPPAPTTSTATTTLPLPSASQPSNGPKSRSPSPTPPERDMTGPRCIMNMLACEDIIKKYRGEIGASGLTACAVNGTGIDNVMFIIKAVKSAWEFGH